jgi:hypothetical protein
VNVIIGIKHVGGDSLAELVQHLFSGIRAGHNGSVQNEVSLWVEDERNVVHACFRARDGRIGKRPRIWFSSRDEVSDRCEVDECSGEGESREIRSNGSGDGSHQRCGDERKFRGVLNSNQLGNISKRGIGDDVPDGRV